MSVHPLAPLTEEQIESLSGRELDAYIAFYLFGWRWYRGKPYPTGTGFGMYPPLTGNAVRYNFRHEWFTEARGWPLPDVRFRDWDRCGTDDGRYDDRNRRLGYDGLPLYSTRWDHAALVIDAMAKRTDALGEDRRGWWCSIKGPFEPGKPWFAGFTPHSCTGWNGRPDNQCHGDTGPEAICRSALLAIIMREGSDG